MKLNLKHFKISSIHKRRLTYYLIYRMFFLTINVKNVENLLDCSG